MRCIGQEDGRTDGRFGKDGQTKLVSSVKGKQRRGKGKGKGKARSSMERFDEKAASFFVALNIQ